MIPSLLSSSLYKPSFSIISKQSIFNDLSYNLVPPFNPDFSHFSTLNVLQDVVLCGAGGSCIYFPVRSFLKAEMKNDENNNQEYGLFYILRTAGVYYPTMIGLFMIFLGIDSIIESEIYSSMSKKIPGSINETT